MKNHRKFELLLDDFDDDLPRCEPGSVYRDLGVEPIINCTGVRTQFGGSNPAPEVIFAMARAAEAFVDLDELAEGVGRKLAQLTGAEWGIVTASTTAALALATAACIAGNDPDLMLRLPCTKGLPNRVLIPSDHRFDYDQAVLVAGAEIISVPNAAELTNFLDDSVVMICLLGRSDPISTLPLTRIVPLAKTLCIPILVDAAGLSPESPDRWLQQGADLVVYSGGKYLRAPQSTAILLGSKRLCKAAWFNGPPHQAFGRTMKIGKEEIIGAVMGLDRWLNHRSAANERAQWLPRLRHIDQRLSRIRGISTELLPASASVTVPRLRISWDVEDVVVDSGVVRRQLLSGSPRILIHDFWATERTIVIDPFNISDQEADLVASALASILTRARKIKMEPLPEPQLDLSGTWKVFVSFLHRDAVHRLELSQANTRIIGRHLVRSSLGTIEGQVRGHEMSLVARHRRDPMCLFYSFNGAMREGRLEGTVALGAASDEHDGPIFQRQFGEATWSAERCSANLSS